MLNQAYFRYTISYIGLLLFNLFIIVNLYQAIGNKQAIIFFSMVLLFTASALMSQRLKYTHLLKGNFVPLLLFLSLFIVNCYSNSDNIIQAFNYTFGTTGGLIFYLILGIMMSFFIADIYDALKLAVSPSLIYISIICLVTFILFFVNDIYQLNRLRAQELLLLTTIDVEYYQYKGNLLFIQFLNTCSLFVAYFSSCTKISVRILFISFTFIALLTYLQVGYAMLLGSNSGVISICCSFLVFVGYLIFIYKTTKYTKASINFYNLNKCTLISIFLFGSIAFIFADNILFHIIDILDSMMIDTSRIRLFGYGSELTSFTARHDIMKNNFMTHFLYNPLTGNMYVDYYTTGGGTYVHNILSFITHTGIIGFMFFAWFVIQSYKGMFHHAHDIDTLYYNHAYSVYRVMFLSLILLFGSLSSFLTWAPLWFGIGCFALNFISPQLGVTE